MKCPRCWTEKAYLRHTPGWKGVLLAFALLRPMKCQHCYHKFVVLWFQTLGKQVRPPALRPASVRPGGLSYAAQRQSNRDSAGDERQAPPAPGRPKRAA